MEKKCLIHEEGELTDNHGVCFTCKQESYYIIKELVRRGHLPKWVEDLPCWIDYNQ